MCFLEIPTTIIKEMATAPALSQTQASPLLKYSRTFMDDASQRTILFTETTANHFRNRIQDKGQDKIKED
jgi:hypothetical protein